jgi:hypothetical protein
LPHAVSTNSHNLHNLHNFVATEVMKVTEVMDPRTDEDNIRRMP